MPCYQSSGIPGGVSTAGRTGFATQAACLEACKEGACCEGTTCTVKPACQCQGTGKTFKGVGTTCSPNPCVCLCDASSVSVEIAAENFLRQVLFRDPVYGGLKKFTYCFVAAPSSGTFELSEEPVDAGQGVGLSPSKWVSTEVQSPGSGRIIATFGRPDGNSSVAVTLGIPVYYMRASGFLTFEEMLVLGQQLPRQIGTGYGSIVATMTCTNNISRTMAYTVEAELGWNVIGATVPLAVCDFLQAGFLNGLSYLWDGPRLSKIEPEPYLLQNHWVIEEDNRSGGSTVTLQALNFSCKEGNPLP